ncbi:lipoxygenase family protein [Halioglobus pacificus]|uniref:Lipoxygenase domain-containing protein n=1 Tax=Parahalioglobus pacificus TaxID=930806 RepID=A0A918XEF1_9GAMM|nr:lipoxygenase family protein [Halioglobus pacificus]GHD27090.1 hypothetical protein GCM10007053_04940 [Halioglobus pacificus]
MHVLGKLGLWLMVAGIIALVAMNSLFSRRRMSHDNGMVCRARIKVLDDVAIPPSAFFAPGKEYPCRFRHASVSFADDARLVVRSASLKFSDTDHQSPLDIMMNTGTAGPFSNAWHFLKFMIATIRGREKHIKPYLDQYPDLAKGITQSICYPDTFALLNYHSKTALGYRDSNGKDWYIKFKLAPWDRGPDRGRPTDEELEQFWLQAPKEGETRSRNFLKDEYRRRIKQGPVKYHLQAQFHPVTPGEDRIVLDCGVAWDEESHPWQDLAEVEVYEVVPTDEGNITWYDVNNHPPNMYIPEAQSILDPASINYLRAKDGLAKRARMQGYQWFGQLPPLVDDRQGGRCALPRICLPADEPDATSEMRADELISQRDIYVFKSDDGLPPYAKYLPKNEEFTTAKSRGMIKTMGYGLLNGFISEFEEIFERRRSLATFDRHYPLWKKPPVSDRFGSDLEFGRQRMNGVNPVLIKRCTRLPDKFPVTNDMVKPQLDEGDTLSKAARRGSLYLLDHEAVGGIPIKNGYLAVPISLFYCNGRGQLVPLAIQLEQQSGPDVPIFTPNDPYWLWTTVKAYVQAADALYHEVASHLLRTHMVMETFVVATHRQLHHRHPVHQLLLPHFHATLAINHSARSVMLAPGGPIDKTLSLGAAGCMELLKCEYQKWDFSQCHLPSDLKNRGVDDVKKLPQYFYRDDGLLIWQALDRFVGSVLAHWYPDDAALASDAELQAWIAELADPEVGKVKGLPEGGKLTQRDSLQQVLTAIIFTCTAEHASVNNGQYDMFGYPPNVPGSMYAPYPTSKANAMSEEDFVACLPNHGKCDAQMQMVYLLSQPTRWQIGNFEQPYFHGVQQIWHMVKDFRAELASISATIQERNRGVEVPYRYLDPVQIGESIAI